MKRGEIHLAVWPADPHRKPRPVLIVSNDFRNADPRLLNVVVLKLTSLLRKDGSRKVVNSAEDVVVTLKKETVIRGAAIFTIEKSCLKGALGELPPATMRSVDERLKITLGL